MVVDWQLRRKERNYEELRLQEIVPRTCCSVKCGSVGEVEMRCF